MTDAVRDQLEQAVKRGYVAAFRWLGNPDESRDACQEAAARAWSARDRYDPAKPFYPWFYRILKNHCLDRLKIRQRIVCSPDPAETTPAAQASVEAPVLQSERAQAVARAIAGLPDELREIIELRHFQDASYEEIAAILNCPVGTVMSRLYRARKALRAKLIADPGFRPDVAQGGPGP
jgi:RNA polymerase sigma-70 factor (ECF subfamily)